MEKLTIKDLMNIGIFAALYFVCVGIGTLIGAFVMHSGHMFLAPVFAALISGTVYMVLVAKTKKFGAITLVGVLMATFFLLSGHFFFSFIPSLVCGVLADIIAKIKHYQSNTVNLISYIIFSFGNLGPIILMWVMEEAYVQRLIEKGKDATYIANVMVPFNTNTVLFYLVTISIAALIGGLFGQHLMKKHFVKAGMI